MPDEKAGKPLPKPVNLKDQVLPYIQGNWGSRVRKLTLTAIIRHLVDDDTAYFTANSLGDETILMIDIDCHASGTLEGATQFAEYLKRELLPEPLLRDLHPRQRRARVRRRGQELLDGGAVQGRARRAGEVAQAGAALDDFDVEDVELKGTPMTVEWGAGGGKCEE